MQLQPGALLRGKYLLVSSIGRGGMGEVFAAKRTYDGAEVAIKVVSRTVVDDTLMARLEREAVAARRIKSLFVPEVYEIDRTQDGELFLVMRRLHGQSLSERLRVRPVLPWDEVRRIVDDALSGLADAHAAGVVHRDLKPGNIFLDQGEAPTLPAGVLDPSAPPPPAPQTERAMILDFGVCKLDQSDGEKLTITGESVGTVSYMAPEQIRGASDVDGRADLYALAMVAFEMLCGRVAYEAQGQMAILAAKLEGHAMRVRDCTQTMIPAGLDALLARCLSRKSGDRFADALEMQRAWRALGPATEAPRALPIVHGGHVAVPTETAVTAATHTRVGSAASRVGLGFALFAVVAAAVAMVFVFRSEPSRPLGALPASSSAAAAAAPQPSVDPAPAETAPVPSAAPVTVQSTTVLDIDGVTPTLDAGKKHVVKRVRHYWYHPKPAPTHTGITTEPRY